MTMSIKYKEALLRRLSMLRGHDGDASEYAAISELLASAEAVI